jgi:monoamine oxidase
MSLFRRSFALFLVLTALVASTWCISDNQTVVIIGGGVAGLSAAYRLRSMGVKNVIIIEAMNRLGGRINTITYRNSRTLFQTKILFLN